MAAPTPTTRQTPNGNMLEDGFSSLVTLAIDPDIELWEKTVTPPGVDGGDPIDITTMHNTEWRTKAPRSLKDLTDATFTAAYDPSLYNNITNSCNVDTTITVLFPNGDTVAFYGFLRTFAPDNLSEGEHPTATVTITATNRDPNTGAEESPVWTAAGT